MKTSQSHLADLGSAVNKFLVDFILGKLNEMDAKLDDGLAQMKAILDKLDNHFDINLDELNLGDPEGKGGINQNGNGQLPPGNLQNLFIPPYPPPFPPANWLHADGGAGEAAQNANNAQPMDVVHNAQFIQPAAGNLVGGVAHVPPAVGNGRAGDIVQNAQHIQPAVGNALELSMLVMPSKMPNTSSRPLETSLVE